MTGEPTIRGSPALNRLPIRPDASLLRQETRERRVFKILYSLTSQVLQFTVN